MFNQMCYHEADGVSLATREEDNGVLHRIPVCCDMLAQGGAKQSHRQLPLRFKPQSAPDCLATVPSSSVGPSFLGHSFGRPKQQFVLHVLTF